jgi:hypothetical protein
MEQVETIIVGGGVFNNPGATLNSRNTLLAGNTVFDANTTPVLNDCFGEIWSDHSRFSFIPNNCSVIGPSWFLTNPNGIGQLADNGGATLTVALLPGSDAIDAADPVQGCVNMDSVLLTDQRGARASLAPAATSGRTSSVRCCLGCFCRWSSADAATRRDL